MEEAKVAKVFRSTDTRQQSNMIIVQMGVKLLCRDEELACFTNLSDIALDPKTGRNWCPVVRWAS